jgi:hypothetical protein
MFGNPLGLEVGLSAWGFGSDVIIFIPVGAKLYLIPKDASFYFAGGAVVVTNPVESGPFSDESMTYGYAGIGFEYRSNSGFLFRGTAYGLIAEGSFLIWPGLYVGYAF